MKPLILTLISTIFFSQVNFSQVEKVEFELEKTPFKMSLNSGVYKSRLSGASERENRSVRYTTNNPTVPTCNP